MLFTASSAESDATLRAMKVVATAGGADALSDADRVALTAAHTVVFGGHGTLDADVLPDISAPELAAIVTDANREHAAAFMAVMATVDGVVDVERIQTAVDYVDELGLQEDYLRDLGELAQRTFAEVRVDVARHNVRSFTGVELDDPADAADGEYPDWYHPSA